ncbi:start domain-containing protein [Ceratobasidium sp. AG-Ba]|nr:start domain-containing protein [Ceratobasidium sp. AG-Ba]
MSDGARLHELWATALDDASATLKTLAGTSSGWVRVGGTGPASVHKKGAVLRVVQDIEGDEEAGIPDVDDWRAVFGSPELRKEWDGMVDKAQVLEVVDSNTRVSKTDYVLGWPANPRDAITISRTVHEDNTLVDVATSLPRSADEPAFLRPSPPSVRSHVHLLAWYIQLPTPPATSTRITLYWQHDLRNAWPLSSSSPSTALASLLPALYNVAAQRAPRAPLLHRWGSRAVIDGSSYDPGRAALRLDYTIVPEDDHPSGSGAYEVEVWLAPTHAWEVQITTRAASDKVASLPWVVHASRSGSGGEKDRTIIRVAHTPVPAHSASALKVRFVVELGGGSRGSLRVNGAPHAISPARAAPRPETGPGFAPKTNTEILSAFPATTTKTANGIATGRPGSITSATITTATTQSRTTSISSSSRLTPNTTLRPSSHQKAIQTLIRRSYTYFTALLQEPDQKWKPLLESRGVTVTQLDSIDPTLVVYRAEATFVGVGVWDLLGALGCEPARSVWEKGIEDVKLIEDVNELTELWWVKQRAAWPVKDTILLKTSYKSPTAAHVFSFSTTDSTLFPALPPPELPTIRTHVDLHGFAIEALSPTTTLLTLLEQSRTKTGAASMVATLAGIGEMVIRGGGAPPVVSRLSGARKTRVRYEHERGVWRVEYEKSERVGSVDDTKEKEKGRTGGRRATIASSLRNESREDETTTGDEEPDELGASVATLIPESNRRRSSPLSMSTTLSSSPDSISRTSLAPSSTSVSSNQGIAFPSLESANNSNSTITNMNKPDQSAPLPPIELELRIDPDTWSPLELVVDPPPSSVRALRRHRLARGGGGLWVTIEHAIEPGWDERISVVARKGNGVVGSTGRDILKDKGESGEDSSPETPSPVIRTARDELLRLRTGSDARPIPERSPTSLTLPATPRPPTLIVNGARVKVDVEELAEAEAKALARAKRVKPTRVPLDEPPVVWTRRARKDTMNTVDTGVAEGTGTDTEAEGTTGSSFKMGWGLGMGTLGLGMGVSERCGRLQAAWQAAPDVQSGVETVVTSVAQPSSLLRLVTNTPMVSAAPTVSPQPPMASSLDALKFLVRQHAANATPDAIPTADGWTPVNTKAGLTVTRRSEPAFSSTLPVHRCAKVLQGVSAEDVASAITCAGSRRQWDTWFDGGASAVLEEYGAGARTEFTVLKGGFPFRDRGFYVSSMTTRTSAALNTKSKDAGSSGNPALIFLASSSYAPEGVQQFAPGKVNPYSLPVGQMPLYGWVIETLDPYTAENYAIPSARCTLYVCVDYGGQVPATYNAMVNATLPRASIAGVEAFLGGGSRASVPMVRYPASVLGMVRESEEEAAKSGLVWTLGNEDQRRTFLGSSYSQTANMFQASVRLSPFTVRPPPPSPQMPASAIEPSSGSLLTVGSHHRHTSNGGASGGTSPGGGNTASWGRSAGRLAISPRHRSRTLSSSAKAPSDSLTVAEFIVDSRLFPTGYDITTASKFLTDDSSQPISLLGVDDSTYTTRDLPLKVSIYTIPLSPLRASAQPTRQLIRVTLPQVPQATQEVLDPLTGETRRGPEQPEWVKRLAAERAVVRVTIGPGAIKDKHRADGGIVDVLSEKKSVVALGRAALEEEYVAGYPLLKRVKHVEGGQRVPNMLATPAAAATHLYSDEPVAKPVPVIEEKVTEEPASAAEASTSPDVPIISTPKASARPTPSRRPSASAIFGFLSSYASSPSTRMPPINDAEKETKPPAPPASPAPPLPTIPEPAAVGVLQPTPAQSFLFDRRHSGARLIIVALIAFLIGSLLRSLISPADFIYMGPTAPTNDHLDSDGWRQVKRLVEIKYGWWGWDFVVAVVRRP